MKIQYISVQLKNGTIISLSGIPKAAAKGIINTNVQYVYWKDESGKLVRSFAKSWATWNERLKIWQCNRIGGGAYGDSVFFANGTCF